MQACTIIGIQHIMLINRSAILILEQQDFITTKSWPNDRYLLPQKKNGGTQLFKKSY